MNHVPELRVEVVAGAIPTPFAEQGPKGFDVKGDAIARCNRLTDIVGRQTIREAELVVEPGFCNTVKCLGSQAQAGKSSEIVGLDPAGDQRAHFVGNS